MCGLPRSGKSTYAKALQEAGYVRLCPDDFRRAIHGRSYHAAAEQLVWAVVDAAARALLMSGHAVIVDATNTIRYRRAGWLRIAREIGVPAEAFVMATSAEECHKRNRASPRPVPSEVIDRMAAQWEPVQAGPEGLVIRTIDG